MPDIVTAAQVALAAASAAPAAGTYALRHRIHDTVLGREPVRIALGREVETRGGPQKRPHRNRRDPRQMGPLARFKEQAKLALLARTVGLRLADLMTHLQIVGPTNQGKTQLMLLIAEQLLSQGTGVLIHETGGDFGRKLIPYARAHGVPLFVFDPLDDRAHKLNPIAGRPEDAAGRAAASLQAVGSSSEDFFRVFGSNMLRAVVLAAHAYTKAHGGEPTLALARKIATDHDTRVKALGLQRRGARPSGQGRSSDAGRFTVTTPHLDRYAKDFWEQEYYGNWSDKQRNEFSQGMKGAVEMLLNNSLVREAVCPDAQDARVFTLREAIECGGLVVLRCAPGARSDGLTLDVEVARALSVWLIQLIQQTVIQRDPDTASPIVAFFDEVHNTLGRNAESAAEEFSHWITMARHFKVGCVFAYQGFEMIPHALKVAFGGNLSNKLVCGGLEADDAEYIQRQLGDDAATVSKTTAKKGAFAVSSGPVSTITSEEERHRFAVDEIVSLPHGYWILSGRAQMRGQRLYPTLLKAPLPPTVEEVRQRRHRGTPPASAPKAPTNRSAA